MNLPSMFSVVSFSPLYEKTKKTFGCAYWAWRKYRMSKKPNPSGGQRPGANPTIVSYNAGVVKILSSTNI
jgi:hypothetical protein